MLDALARLLPPINKFLDQIWPSVVATLIAAGLISGYNHAFSGHLQQPRMAMLKTATDAVPLPADTGPTVTVVSKPQAIPAAEYFARRERAIEPAQPLEKEASTEAGKDQSAIRVAVQTPAPQPALRPAIVATPTPRPEPRVTERHVEPRVASVPYVVPPPAQPATTQTVTIAPMAPPSVATAPLAPPPVVAGPPTVILASPPPVVMAQPPAGPQQMVTVPDRQYPRPPYEAQAEDVPPPPAPQGPIGAIVNTLKPSTWFARMREFGDKIEATGNEILPNIRQ